MTTKVSGLVHLEDTHLERVFAIALDTFGPRRLMFGSDHPICLQETTYRVVLERTQRMLERNGSSDWSGFWVGNAERVYAIR